MNDNFTPEGVPIEQEEEEEPEYKYKRAKWDFLQ